MIFVNITSAKAHLSSLLKKLEDNDEEIVIERSGKPIAKLLKYDTSNSINRLGALRGQIIISEDFEELSDDIAIKFGIRE